MQQVGWRTHINFYHYHKQKHFYGIDLSHKGNSLTIDSLFHFLSGDLEKEKRRLQKIWAGSEDVSEPRRIRNLAKEKPVEEKDRFQEGENKALKVGK